MSWIPKTLWLRFFAAWIILLFLFILILSGAVKLGCKGVCVDSTGKIYVGLEEEIRVYDETGALLRTISPRTSKGYDFGIDGDALIVNANGKTYLMDLEGKLISSGPESQTLKSTPKTVTVNGSVYHIFASSLYYRVTIQQNGEKTVPVQMPFPDLLAEGLFLAWIAVFLVSFVPVLKAIRRHNRQT